VQGTYTVSLEATNANGSHTRVYPNLIEVSVPVPLHLALPLQLALGLSGVAWLHARRRRN
jgi:hypothetical protein